MAQGWTFNGACYTEAGLKEAITGAYGKAAGSFSFQTVVEDSFSIFQTGSTYYIRYKTTGPYSSTTGYSLSSSQAYYMSLITTQCDLVTEQGGIFSPLAIQDVFISLAFVLLFFHGFSQGRK